MSIALLNGAIVDGLNVVCCCCCVLLFSFISVCIRSCAYFCDSFGKLHSPGYNGRVTGTPLSKIRFFLHTDDLKILLFNSNLMTFLDNFVKNDNFH